MMAITVHPHVCGEARALPENRHERDGSPPRVWGSLKDHYSATYPERFTPTCVGKPRINHEEKRNFSVHPHVCGEACVRGLDEEPSRGSPPRVWGSPVVKGVIVASARFTPTCVGKPESPS